MQNAAPELASREGLILPYFHENEICELVEKFDTLIFEFNFSALTIQLFRDSIY